MRHKRKAAQPFEGTTEPGNKIKQCDYITEREEMSSTINHEAFMADAYPHLKALSELVQLYGYGEFVYATFSEYGSIHVNCFSKGLEYSEVPTPAGLYKKIGKEVA